MTQPINTTIATTTPKDIGQIHAIEQECNPNPWNRTDLETATANPNALFLTMRRKEDSGKDKDEEIIGFIHGTMVLDELEICGVAVKPEFQGKGLGQTLINRALTEATAKGAVRAFLEVRASNHRAIRAYEKCGFAADGIRKGYYRGGEDAVLMSAGLGW